MAVEYNRFVHEEWPAAQLAYRERKSASGLPMSPGQQAHWAWQRLRDGRKLENWLEAIRKDDVENVPWEYENPEPEPEPEPEPTLRFDDWPSSLL